LAYQNRELMLAQSVFNCKRKCAIDRVTNKPIKEIASEVLAIINAHEIHNRHQAGID